MNCYSGPYEMMNWTSAEKSCEQKGAHLTSIHSIEENNFLLSNLIMLDTNPTGPFIFIGGVRANGSFRWTDGTNFKYTNWIDGLPYDPSFDDMLDVIAIQFDTGESKYDGLWTIFTDYDHFKYICKKSKQGKSIVFLYDQKTQDINVK